MAKRRKKNKKIEIVPSEGEELPLLEKEILGEAGIPLEEESEEVVFEEEVEEFSPEEEIEKLIEEYKGSVEIVEDVGPSIPAGMIPIRYLGVPDVFIIKGPVTRQRYRFTAKDRISNVAIEDYGELLQKVRSARGCCGRRAGDPGKIVPEQPYFGPA